MGHLILYTSARTIQSMLCDRIEKRGEPTNSAREHGFIVDITLDPCHEMLDVFGCRHLGRTFVVL